MEIIVLAFLFVAILFYLLFGGADFGVGVLEFFSSKKNKMITKQTAYRIIGPVWEANHVWLIVVIVIMWIGFPIYYNIIVTQLHIPLSLLLLGIIARGTAFVFRHYDAYKDDSQKFYDKIFQYASVFTPFIIGVIIGAILSGEMIHPDAIEGKDFYTLYIATWWNGFSFFTGLFVTSLTAYISSIFLSTETLADEKKYYRKKAQRASVFVLVTGALVFLEAAISDRFFFQIYAENVWTWAILVAGGLLFIPIWRGILSGNVWMPRFWMAFQIVMILTVWVIDIFPHLILFKEGELGLTDNPVPDAVYTSLGGALLIASVFVLPGLYHLYKTFGLVNTKK